ncbi:hypothetical protein LPB140_10970 [Sphingorhabdus lutea]|uniref:N-acetyltransferase domain-containing protein n=1 Tax=Sphingorhabdus lutea TaxID=1913578 RepID=A0A1L3JFB6_9SPHN|nr:hypothetical protein LPB140_10970 [Sphingorhabdus lutea]
MIFRPPVANDAAMLAQFGRDSFCEAFAHLYSAENLTTFLNDVHNIENINAQIEANNVHYMLAEDAADNGKLIGYCKISEKSKLDYDQNGPHTCEFSQLYVLASHHGSGVAQKLMDWAIQSAKSRGFKELVLSVYSDNPRAQSFYQKYGFTYYCDTIFMVGTHRDDEYIYRLIL